ncbi:MAG: diguanylate cyclase domain-containing protein [Pseudomonadota bacterium]
MLPAILVVDDQDNNLVAMEAVFEGEPVELVTANSGAEGLRLMLQRDFALVLLDVQMPELDGFEVAEIVRSNPRTAATPIVFLTALSQEPRYVFRGYESGAVDYLFKPIDPVILRSKVRVFLELERKSRILRESLRLLQEERDHNQALLRSLSEGLLGITPGGNIFYANPMAEQMLGRGLDELIGQRLTDIFVLCNEEGGELGWPLAEFLSTCARGERVHRDDLFLQRGGVSVAIEVTANPLLPDMGGVAGIVVLFRDISSRRQQEKALQRRATLDALTGLSNRAEFDHQLAERIAAANRSETSLALLYLDLDRFKAINDSRGHHAGDQVLQAVAQRLRDCLRGSDLVARLGGDEFAIVLQGSDPHRAASRVAGKILQALTKEIGLDDGGAVQTGISIGIALYPDDSTHADELLRSADQAMYQAKGGGRNGFRFCSG